MWQMEIKQTTEHFVETNFEKKISTNQEKRKVYKHCENGLLAATGGTYFMSKHLQMYFEQKTYCSDESQNA